MQKIFKINLIPLCLSVLLVGVSFACKQPFASDLSEYKGESRNFAGSIENGRLKLTVGSSPAKLHDVQVKISKQAALGTSGVTIGLEDIKLPAGKLETGSGTADIEICFLRADSTLKGGAIICANFKKACEGDNEEDKALYGGTFSATNGGLCACKTGGTSETQVGFSDFLAKSGPGLLCQEIRLKETKITDALIQEFRTACVDPKVKGTFTANNIKDATCACQGANAPISITAAMGAAESDENTKKKNVAEHLQKQCMNRAVISAELCQKLSTLAAPDKFELVGQSGDNSEKCECRKTNPVGKFEKINLSIGGLTDQSNIASAANNEIISKTAADCKAATAEQNQPEDEGKPPVEQEPKDPSASTPPANGNAEGVDKPPVDQEPE